MGRNYGETSIREGRRRSYTFDIAVHDAQIVQILESQDHMYDLVVQTCIINTGDRRVYILYRQSEDDSPMDFA